MTEPTIRAYPRSLARNMDLTGRQDISSSVKNIALNMYETGWLPPSGAVFPYAATGAPFGYLLCDGAAVSRDLYSSLYYAIGETYGPGDGQTTFNVPNMKGFFPVMLDTANPNFSSLGQTGGSGTANTGGGGAGAGNSGSAQGGAGCSAIVIIKLVG